MKFYFCVCVYMCVCMRVGVGVCGGMCVCLYLSSQGLPIYYINLTLKTLLYAYHSADS